MHPELTFRHNLIQGIFEQDAGTGEIRTMRKLIALFLSVLTAMTPVLAEAAPSPETDPEGNAEARFKISGVRRIFFYCNRDGLFSIDPVKGIDDRESGYDDSQERRELEKAAKILFG